MFNGCDPPSVLPCETLHATSWALIAVGLVVTVVAVAVMVRAVMQWREKRGREKGRRSEGALISLVLKCTLPWAPCLRVADMLSSTIADGYYELLGEAWGQQGWGEIFLSSLPGYILVATYLLLVLFWAWLYGQAKGGAALSVLVADPLTVWLVCVAAEFVVYLVLLMLMAAMPGSRGVLHQVEACYAAALYLLCAVLFLGWGAVLYAKVRSASTHSQRSQLLANKIFVLTLVCTFLFTARTVIVLLETFRFTSPGWVGFSLTICWTFGCEYLPALLMIIILHWSSESHRKQEARDTVPETKPLTSVPINAPF